jgi:photosystem II stability/assembly factor-like uncharacterized protein
VAVGSNGVVRRGVPTVSFPVMAGRYGLPSLRSVSSDRNGHLVCGGDSGLLGFSSDAGASWSFEQHTDVGNITQVVLTKAGAALIATDKGLYRIAMLGTPTKLIDGPLAGVSIAPSGMITVGYVDGQVATSMDSGSTWAGDTALSSSWTIVTLVTDGERTLVVHKRFVTWRNPNTSIDTSYIPADVEFTFTDLSIDGPRWWATGMDIALRHACSADRGRTWNVSNGFLIRASRAIDVYGKRVFAVGQRGTYVYGHQDSAVTTAYKVAGFMPPSKEVPISAVKGLVSQPDAVYVLRQEPVVSIARYSERIDTLFRMSATNSVAALAVYVHGSRVTAILDTSTQVKTTQGWVTKRKFRFVTIDMRDSGITIVDAPAWDLPITTWHADSVGNIFVGCDGLPYIFRYNSETAVLDSLENVPFESTTSLAGANGILVVVGNTSCAVSLDYGQTWQPVNSSLPWIPHGSCMGPSGRIFIARLDLISGNRRLRVATSDDFGLSWQEQVDRNVAGALHSVAHIEASDQNRVVMSGLGNTIIVSVDNGRSFHEITTPALNTATLYASTFIGDTSVAVGGTSDALFRGRLEISTSVTDSATRHNISLDSRSVVSVMEYNLLGQLLCSKRDHTPFSIQEYITSTETTSTRAVLLVCMDIAGQIRCLSLIR